MALVSGGLSFADFHGKLIEVLPRAEEALMTIAEELRREGLLRGRKEGRKEGRAEGRVIALREILTKQLVLKFGDLAQAHEARVEAASIEQLERYIERILIAENLDELFES